LDGLIAVSRLERFDGPMNLGNPSEITMKELAVAVLEETRSSSQLTYKPLPADDPRQRKPDIALAQKLIGWSPAVSLREGIRRTVEYFQSIVVEGVPKHGSIYPAPNN
jgi:UDP-glucuronate decarboxylase